MSQRNLKKKVYVIGAGMSGLATALRLAELGTPTILIEKEKAVGGLAGSFAWGPFKNLDYGPHIYHTPDSRLQAYWEKEFGDLFYKNEFWGKNVKGKKFNQYFDYPLSFESLKKFPDETRKKILEELAHLDETKRAKATSYSEYVRELVGPTLMQYFFIRYPQKLWGVSVDQMTANWAPKRVNFRTKDEHFHAGQWSAVGKYGSGKILASMADRFKRAGGTLLLGTGVTALEHSRGTIKKIILEGDKSFALSPQDLVVSTMPIPVLATYLGVKNTLKYRGAKLIFVAVKKHTVLPDKFNFLYYDAPEIIFHRVSEQKKFCPNGFPKDKTVLTLEIAYTKGDALDTGNEQTLTKRAVKDLSTVGLIKKSEVIDTKVASLPYVYPLMVKGSEAEVVDVRSKLGSFKQLYCIGTGGDFRYDDLQVLNIRGTDLAERLASPDAHGPQNELVKKNTAFVFNQSVALGSHTVAPSGPAFIIAEIGLNHNGNLKLALELIDKAKAAGASAVKFQTYRTENRISRVVKENRYAEELIDQEENTYDMLHRLELSQKDHEKIFAYARKKGVEVFSTPFDLESVDLLESLDAPFYKISSMDLVNLPLIKKVAETSKPLIISTGMSTMGQVEEAVEVVREAGNPNLILLHCISSYPAAPEDMNLAVIDTLAKAFGCPVGLSDHSIGLTVAGVALARGARVIERHFTLDRFMEGPDHILSSEPEEMRELVRLSHVIPLIEGSPEKVIVGRERETINRFKKGLYANTNIRKGQKITKEMIAIKGPGGALLPKYLDVLIGKTAKQSVAKDHPLGWEHF